MTPPPETSPVPLETSDSTWLEAFHAGNRACLEGCYHDHFETVDRVVGRILTGAADRDAVVHEVFFRLLHEPSLRASFRGGAFAAWLRVVARNEAVDHARRRNAEAEAIRRAHEGDQWQVEDRLEERIAARQILERFSAEVLPEKWRPVFMVRFLQQQDQPTAARSLRMHRTTLAYQEYRIRQLLRRFVLQGSPR